MGRSVSGLPTWPSPVGACDARACRPGPFGKPISVLLRYVFVEMYAREFHCCARRLAWRQQRQAAACITVSKNRLPAAHTGHWRPDMASHRSQVVSLQQHPLLPLLRPPVPQLPQLWVAIIQVLSRSQPRVLRAHVCGRRQAPRCHQTRRSNRHAREGTMIGEDDGF